MGVSAESVKVKWFSSGTERIRSFTVGRRSVGVTLQEQDSFTGFRCSGTNRWNS